MSTDKMSTDETTTIVTRDPKGRFLKGQSGNPSGRSPRVNQARYMTIMNEVVNDAAWYAICERAVKDAKNGFHPARKWVADYVVGPPIKRSELAVSGDVVLSGPSLDRRVKLVMAIFAAVLVAGDESTESNESNPISIESSDIIDGVIVGQEENVGNDG